MEITVYYVDAVHPRTNKTVGRAHRVWDCRTMPSTAKPRRAVEVGEMFVKLTGGITPVLVEKCSRCWE